MAFTPTPGPVALLKVAPSPAGTPATIPAINWKLMVDGKLKDISNFLVGRYPQQTLEDADATFTLVWDSDTQPHTVVAPGIDVGLNVLARFYTDAAKFWLGTFKIGTVGVGVESLEGVVMYEVTAKLVGTLTRPV